MFKLLQLKEQNYMSKFIEYINALMITNNLGLIIEEAV